MHLASVAQFCFLPITFFGLSQHKGFGYLKSELDKLGAQALKDILKSKAQSVVVTVITYHFYFISGPRH